MIMDWQKYFCGAVNIEKSAQVMTLEMIPLMYTVTDEGTGEVKEYITDYRRNLYVGKYETRTYVFEGVPASEVMNLTGSVVVSDINGVNHTVYLDPKIVDASSGSAIFEKETNQVSIHKMSPHMRRIEVVRRLGELYCNGAYVFGSLAF